MGCLILGPSWPVKGIPFWLNWERESHFEEKASLPRQALCGYRPIDPVERAILSGMLLLQHKNILIQTYFC